MRSLIMPNTTEKPVLKCSRQFDGKLIAWCSHGDKVIEIEEPGKAEADFVLKAEKAFRHHRLEKHSDWQESAVGTI
jgi:hypothetical protein